STDIDLALSVIKQAPFALRLSSVGFFPLRRAPESVWAGVAASEQLEHLHKTIDRALIRCSVKPEGRKYLPHVTIGRFAKKRSPNGERLGDYLSQHNLFSTDEFEVDNFSLFSSHRSGSGRIYIEEANYPFEIAGSDLL
ncbi:MAG: RNA 2',3'-cyclic phosphodiesterase, partial [candidate division Zixibacteria bacterium]